MCLCSISRVWSGRRVSAPGKEIQDRVRECSQGMHGMGITGRRSGQSTSSESLITSLSHRLTPNLGSDSGVSPPLRPQTHTGHEDCRTWHPMSQSGSPVPDISRTVPCHVCVSADLGRSLRSPARHVICCRASSNAGDFISHRKSGDAWSASSST